MQIRKINFCNEGLDTEAATSHFLFIGATGSGKTVLIRLLMQSVLFNNRENPVLDRAVIYDAKSDALPVLHGIVGRDDYGQRLNHKVVTLNPFDRRSYSWDISADIKTPGHALQMASILIPPDEKASQPFFANAARHLLYGVLIVFIRSQVRWTLRDVLCALKDSKRLCAVLESDIQTKRLVDLYFSHTETAKNIMSELASRLGAFEIIAALWDKSEREGKTISLDNWLNGAEKRILVLGSDPTNRFALDAINQVIFKRISELVLAQPDSKERRTWFFLDEFVRAGKLNGIVDLATEGRSKGACIVLGFQDINGARAVYGKEVAEEIIGQCTNIAVLRLQSPETAEWASKLFGEYEQTEKKKGRNVGYGTGNTHFGSDEREEIVKRSRILASQFMYMPMTSPKTGLYCFRYSPYGSLQEEPLNGTEIFGTSQPDGEYSGGHLFKSIKSEKGIEFREAEAQYLKDWEIADFQRLNLNDIFSYQKNEEIKNAKSNQLKVITEFAKFAFLQGFSTASQLKDIAKFSPNQRKAFFSILAELKNKDKFLADYPTDTDLEQINLNSSEEEKELSRKIIDLLHEDKKRVVLDRNRLDLLERKIQGDVSNG